MKRFLTVLSAIALSGAALSAQEADTTTVTGQKDTVVVIVKHEYPEKGGFFERTGKPFVKGYKAVEKAVVDGYQAVEDAFVEPFTDTVSTSINYKRGYRADVELSCAIPDTWGITTSHGFSFGNGLYVGGGAGFSAEFLPDYDAKPTYLVPVFADLKYSFLNKLASPFVNFRTGGYADVTNTGIRYFLNPSVGVDIKRFAIKVGYEYQVGVWKNSLGTNKHNVKCGVAFTF